VNKHIYVYSIMYTVGTVQLIITFDLNLLQESQFFCVNKLWLDPRVYSGTESKCWHFFSSTTFNHTSLWHVFSWHALYL